MNIFKYVKLQSKEREAKCDWGDPTDVLFYLAELRHTERNRVLDSLVPKRICPSCGAVKCLSKSWVVSKDKKRAICRSCYMRKVPCKDLDETSKIPHSIFGEAEIRYKFDGTKFALARVYAEISAREFASFAGWSQSYQYKLESGKVASVNAETAETIMEVFARFGFYTKDEL